MPYKYNAYHVILTHNPQDFFEGIGPDDLTIEMYPESTDDDVWSRVLQLVDGGYVAIMTTLDGG